MQRDLVTRYVRLRLGKIIHQKVEVRRVQMHRGKRKRRVTGRHPAFSGGEKNSFFERDFNIGKRATVL